MAALYRQSAPRSRIGVRAVTGETIRLFSTANLDDVLRGMHATLEVEIPRLSENKILGNTEQELIEYYVEDFTLVPIVLFPDSLVLVQPKEVWEMIQGYSQRRIEYTFELPFAGDVGLFILRTNPYNFSPPEARLESDRICKTFLLAVGEESRLQSLVEHWQEDLQGWLDWQRKQIDDWNAGLHAQISALVRRRREQVLSTRQALESLPFQIRKTGETPTIYQVGLPKRAHSKKELKTLPAERLDRPEPTLEQESFEEILKVLQSMSVVMERSPAAFNSMDEEAIRTHFLVPLNAHFPGEGSGETFNMSGKTDLILKREDRVIFVAECKIWKGPKAMAEAIDQLLGYLTWRENKAAMLVFNRNSSLSGVLDQIPQVFQEHPQFDEQIELSRGLETEFRFRLRSLQDERRKMTVAVLVFDLPKKSSRG